MTTLDAKPAERGEWILIDSKLLLLRMQLLIELPVSRALMGNVSSTQQSATIDFCFVFGAKKTILLTNLSSLVFEWRQYKFLRQF